MNNKNPLIARYGKLPVWVNWKMQTRQGKKTKVPYSPVTDRMASSTDPKTWGTHRQASEQSENIGIVFSGDKLFCGIDIDHCVEDGIIVHEQEVAIGKLISEANTYTELSPSGTGLHLYFELTEPLTLTANRHSPYEVYTEGRYFTVTGESWGTEKPLLKISPADLLALLAGIGYPWGKVDAPTTQALPVSAGSAEVAPPSPPALADQDIISRMFNAHNGDDIKKLYDGDTSHYAGDGSRADAALLSHLAFWTQKDPAAMERIWIASPLGSRKKTATRSDYRTRSINNAVAHCKEVYAPFVRTAGTSLVPEDDDTLDLLYTTKGKQKVFYKNTENVTRILLRHTEFKDTLRFDEYRNVIDRKVGCTATNPNGVWRTINDHDVIDLQTRISILFVDFAHVGKDMVLDAIVNAAHTNKVDTGADYLRGLAWDDKPRLNEWLTKAFNTPNDVYHIAVGSNWLKGMVKRVLEPGCKFDHVLVLEGEQGIKKSTSLLVLAGSLGHVETTVSTEQKDFFMQFLGNAIVEFSEGETLSRTEVKRMKAIITVQNDKFRSPYGRTVEEHPRRCVFAMTTNQTEYLKDETGNRRWLPVAVVGNANIEWLRENREQLLAEACARVISGETTWEFPEKEMKEQQALRRVQDSNADPVVNWYVQLTDSLRNEGVTISQAFSQGLNNGFSGATTKMIEMGIGDVFKSILMLEKRRGMIGGIRCTRWYPSKQTLESIAFMKGEVPQEYATSE